MLVKDGVCARVLCARVCIYDTKVYAVRDNIQAKTSAWQSTILNLITKIH